MKAILIGTVPDSRTKEVSRATRRSGTRAAWPRMLQQSLAQLHEWRCRRRGRAELAQLDDRMLRDIGVSRVDVWREVNKPFWRK